MSLPRGQFITRVDRPPRIISKPFAAAWIYPGVLAAWTYLALYEHDPDGHRPDLAEIISPTVFAAAWVGVLLYDQSLSKKPKPKWLFKLARSLRCRLQHWWQREEGDEQLGTVVSVNNEVRPAQDGLLGEWCGRAGWCASRD